MSLSPTLQLPADSYPNNMWSALWEDVSSSWQLRGGAEKAVLDPQNAEAFHIAGSGKRISASSLSPE
jgi:hypothetical protein